MAKRDVPPVLQRILKGDVALTEKLCLYVNQYLPYRQLKTHYKMLEISCHGVPWLAGWLALVWLLNSPRLYQMQANFYIGLILDLLFVATIKAFVRRRRPQGHTKDDMFEVGPDKFSFPSGHASRAVFIAYFFIVLYPAPFLLYIPLVAWAASVSMSRVFLRRHHLLDVVAGVLLGVFEGLVISWLWLSREGSTFFLSWLTDDDLNSRESEVDF